MRRFVIVLVVMAAIAYVGLSVIGVEPKDRRPGTRLDGDLADTPASWSFTDTAMEVHLETYPWWGVPFSVTTVIARDGQDLFVPSLYEKQADFPGTKFWNTVVQSNPNVRLRVGTDLYELQIAPIQEPAEFERAFQALGRKYPFWAERVAANDTRGRFALLKLSARD